MNTNIATKGASDVAEHSLKEIRDMMRQKGYRSNTTRQSAMYENTFVKGKRRLSVLGWHGSGSYGTGKAIFALYDSDSPVRFGRVFDLLNEMPMKVIDAEVQNEFVKKLMDYLAMKA